MTTRYPLDAAFDVALADTLARLETYNKHHYRPNSYLHKWWARRCGSTFRLILKHLAPDPARRDYYAPGGLAGQVVLDPMMGGGTTLHEAIRLNANVIGVDLDPIPVLQARATLTEVPLADLDQAFRRLFSQLRSQLEPLYETGCPECQQSTQLQYLLYGLRKSCACGPALFVDSLVLRQEGDGSTLCLDPGDGSICRRHGGDRRLVSPRLTPGLPGPIYEKRRRRCPVCDQRYREFLALPFYARYTPLVVVGTCPHDGLFFKAPDEADLDRLAQADARRASLPLDADDFNIEQGRKSRQLILKQVDNYLDLFSSRQLHYLAAAVAALPQWQGAVRLNLALLISTALEFNAMLCGYKGAARRRPGAIRHTFSLHAYSFPHTALENNPVFPRRASGTLQKLFHARIRNGRRWAQQPRERRVAPGTTGFVPIRGEVDGGTEVDSPAALGQGQRRFLLLQASATELALPDRCVDFVITDPPYYDSVQYSDLAAFFRVWLRQLVPAAADWGYDTSESAVDPHKNDGASRYAELLTGIFRECRRVLRPEHGRLVFTYHHWNPKGWAALTGALRAADFELVNRYVVHAENPVSVHINKMKALLHDAVLVLAPHGTGAAGRWQPPDRLETNDSAAFTRDCATLLGALLQQQADQAEIHRCWRDALPGADEP